MVRLAHRLRSDERKKSFSGNFRQVRIDFPRGDGVILQMRARLSVMMFLEYFVWGAWYVTLGTWLGQTLHFSGDQIGIISGTTTIGAILSPFLVGLMADELFASQRLLAVLHGVGGVLLWFASTQTHFGPMYAILLIYSLLYMPTMALTNALAFRQMKDPSRNPGWGPSSGGRRERW